jgi:transcriptional regulator with XRE-family HTH domain
MSRTILKKISLGKRIRFSREHANLTQEELANQINLSRYQLINYESDKIPPPSDKLAIIANNCEVDPGWLLSGKGNPF